jgi:DNA integrity scanning protein DisA with diadenylate cyclase activity
MSGIIATFTSPETIGTTPQSLLWLLPLIASIVIVYKATKVKTITAAVFLKEIASLFFSILFFIIAVALALHIIDWLISAKWSLTP